MKKLKNFVHLISIFTFLRMWPPALQTDRKCVKDYEYDEGALKFKVQKVNSKSKRRSLRNICTHSVDKLFSGDCSVHTDLWNSTRRKIFLKPRSI